MVGVMGRKSCFYREGGYTWCGGGERDWFDGAQLVQE